MLCMGRDNVAEGPVINPGAKKWLMGILAVIIIFIGFIIYSSVNAGSQYGEFAKCISEKGAKMHGAFWCSACAEQKSRFGNSFEHVNYIECSNPDKSQNAICNAAGISSYPTWEFADGSRMQGVLSMQQLSEKTGCSLNSDK